MKSRTILFAGSIAFATLATLFVPVTRHLVWNASPSIPTGLYAIRGKASLHVGERIAVEPPPELRRLMRERGYLPDRMPLLKRVAAVSGQRVCRFAHGVTIDGELVGVARARDRAGRPLPAWFGCRRLRTGELFAMNPAAPDSFDGRYFGTLKIETVIGRAMPVWTDEAGDGDHVWFAQPQFDDPSQPSKGDIP
jgi:conjugative transfer signal peptidase TraF